MKKIPLHDRSGYLASKAIEGFLFVASVCLRGCFGLLGSRSASLSQFPGLFGSSPPAIARV